MFNKNHLNFHFSNKCLQFEWWHKDICLVFLVPGWCALTTLGQAQSCFVVRFSCVVMCSSTDLCLYNNYPFASALLDLSTCELSSSAWLFAWILDWLPVTSVLTSAPATPPLAHSHLHTLCCTSFKSLRRTHTYALECVDPSRLTDPYSLWMGWRHPLPNWNVAPLGSVALHFISCVACGRSWKMFSRGNACVSQSNYLSCITDSTGASQSDCVYAHV